MIRMCSISHLPCKPNGHVVDAGYNKILIGTLHLPSASPKEASGVGLFLFPNSFSFRVLVGLKNAPRGCPPSACGFCRVNCARPVFDDSYILLMHFGPSVPARCPLVARSVPGASWVPLGVPGWFLDAFRVPPGCFLGASGCLLLHTFHVD